MRSPHWSGPALVSLFLLGLPALAQQTKPAPVTLPATNPVAAVVNGQEISETAVQRALRRVPPAKQAEARTEILNFLIDNTLVDQYLVSRQIAVPAGDVDAKVTELREAVKNQGKTTLDKALQEANVTQAELRKQIEAQLRWDKFTTQQATDERAKKFFDQNKDMFNGSTVRARHILLTPDASDPQGTQARAKLAGLKKEIEDKVAQGLAALPANTDEAGREKARAKLTEDAFAAIAAKESVCPSKQRGGDLGYFPRVGIMVEPFAKVAFALKPYEISDIVSTPFGLHLILVTDKKPGKDVQYDKMKDVVKDVYGDFLREAVAKQLRAKATITVNPPGR
ncbi:MAG TPA: peptidylprolyl isomerase [Gemmataceae bacterium]|nr:peptidylprolyl isomerase [Gemmataceae bacterium]